MTGGRKSKEQARHWQCKCACVQANLTSDGASACVQANLTKGALLEAEGWGEWAGCDAALSVEVVEHVRDTDAYAKSLLGCLRCAPRLLFAFPCFAPF